MVLALVGLAVASTWAAGIDGLPPLASELDAGWQRYIAAVEARHARELAGTPARFLVLDHLGDRRERGDLRSGATVVASVPAPPAASQDVPGGRIHHWRGAVFIPGATVDRLVAALEAAPPVQEDILRARMLSRSADELRVYLRIRRTQVVTVVFDTEHVVRFHRLGGGRARSTSRAVRIVELDGAGTPSERAVPPEADRDFLWRLQAYWRYQDVEGGVIAECESVSLSRDVPTGLGLIAGPFIRRAAESSMRAALLALRG